MKLLYNTGLLLFRFIFSIAALFNTKARAFVNGRKNLPEKLQHAFADIQAGVIWIHCASLGEFEQGRPIIERLRSEFADKKILLTFFSPSGYEVRKNYDQADFVFYLPVDSPSHARKFIAITKPELAIFVKYEFWYNYCHELQRQHIPILSVSSIFRKDQLFFKPYGGFYRNILYTFNHFFVQNEESIALLKSIGITACTQAGDTRFDRVNQIVKQKKTIPIVEHFKGSQKVFVIGSCWPDDMDVLSPFINENYYQAKFIIAPHEIDNAFIEEIEQSLQVQCRRYSTIKPDENLDDCQVLIIDNIGMLSHLYQYGEFAYVGGAFGKGLHNILEAACYGIPIFFGNKNYQKYAEANELIMRGGAFEISDYHDLRSKYEMINIPENFMLACEVTRLYVEENLGATEKIMAYCKTLLRVS